MPQSIFFRLERATLAAFTVSLLLAGRDLQAQVPGREVPPAAIIFFLHDVAQVSAGPKAADLGRLIGVSSSDAPIVASASLTYVDAERRLRDEALSYTNGLKNSGRPIDPAIIASFSSRRETLSLAALESIRRRISQSSSAALNEHLSSVAKSIVSWRMK